MNEYENCKLLDAAKNNLKPGELVTYKELCTRLNQPYCGGTQKKSQLNDFKRYFDFEKSNRKLIIKEIYDTVQPKESKSNSLYVKYIECILLSILAKQPENKIYITNKELYRQLGMANDKFFECYNRYKSLVNDDITYFDVCEFYDKCKKNLASILKSSLKSLKNRHLIEHSKPHRIGYYDDNGLIVFRDATDYETSEILRIERETMLKYGCEYEIQIYTSHKDKEYFKDLDEIYRKEYGWEKVHITNKIIYCHKTAIQALSDDKIRLKRLLLNEAIVGKFYRQAERIYDKKRYNQEMLDLFFDDLNFEDIEDENYDAKTLRENTRNMIDNDEAGQYLRKQYYLTDTLIKLD